MAEKKVASRQERLMFEQLIRQDMQNGIQRTISNAQTPSNYSNNNQNRDPNINYTNQNGNYPKVQSPNSQNPNNNNQKNNQSNNTNNGPKRTLAQKFNIRTNKGKRDAVWEQKRQLKFAKYEQLMQEEQQYYDRQLSPKMTPSEANKQMNNYNNGGQYQRGTPNNQPRMTPQEQYQRGTPSNQPRMSPQEQYQRGTPNQKIYSSQVGYQQQQYQRGTPSQPGMTPQGQYRGENQNYDQRMNYRRTPSNDPRVNQEQQYQNSSRTPYNNNQRMSPQQQYQRDNTPYNNNQRKSPQQQYQNGNNTPYNNNQRMSPQQQYQNGNGTPYNRQTPNNYNNDYNNRNSPSHYNQDRQSPNSNNNYPSRTPQPQFNQSRNGMQNQYENYNNNLKGSRTPFIDYRTGQNVYNPRGFTPGQNQYNDIPNRPPSRPFGEISFKGQNGNENLGGRGYSRQNYSNSDNYY